MAGDCFRSSISLPESYDPVVEDTAGHADDVDLLLLEGGQAMSRSLISDLLLFTGTGELRSALSTIRSTMYSTAPDDFQE